MTGHLRLVNPSSPPPPKPAPPTNPYVEEARALIAEWADTPIAPDCEPLDDLVLRIAARLAAAAGGSESHG